MNSCYDIAVEVRRPHLTDLACVLHIDNQMDCPDE